MHFCQQLLLLLSPHPVCVQVKEHNCVLQSVCDAATAAATAAVVAVVAAGGAAEADATRQHAFQQ